MQRPERIWLVRHAETETPMVFHGAESDVGLSDLGRKQARALADWFRSLGPTAVVSSAMRRARDTATPIALACGVPHRIEPELHERRVGDLCGATFSMSEGPWVETVRQWSLGNTAYTTPGAESFDEIAHRVLTAWHRLVAAHPTGRVVVVAHGVVCKAILLSILEGWGPGRWIEFGRVANAAVTELVPDGSNGWTSPVRLLVPEPVVVLTAGQPTGIGTIVTRSEA